MNPENSSLWKPGFRKQYSVEGWLSISIACPAAIQKAVFCGSQYSENSIP
jgi:hypothetical protein